MSIILIILGKLSGLFLVVILGLILYKRKILTDQNLPGISALITGVALPSVILNSFQIPFSLDLLAQGGLFCLLYVILSLVGIVLGIVTSRLLGIKGEQKKVWLFCCGLTNTAFLGTAVANALFTQAEMAMVPFALIISNLMMFTVGPIVLAGQKHFSGRQFARLILNPGNICFVIGLVLFLLSVSLPSGIAQAVSRSAFICLPCAAVSMTACSNTDGLTSGFACGTVALGDGLTSDLMLVARRPAVEVVPSSFFITSIASGVMTPARFCLYNLHAFLLAQFPQYYPYICLDPSIYLHPAIFGSKHNMVLTTPAGMSETTYVFAFHGKVLLISVVLWSANHLYSNGEFLFCLLSSSL